MEQRPAPEVTIEGGPGWQLGGGPEAPGREVRVPEDPGTSWLDRHRLASLVLAAAVGFAAATALAQSRLTTMENSPEGVLSLDVRLEAAEHSSELATAADGRLAVTTSVILRNTGPRPVSLEHAELLGTPYRSDDLAGRRVAAGGHSAVVLLRPVDCDELGRTRAPGPLRVHATTGAGTRTVDLRMNTEVLAFHDEQVRGACGQAGPGQALVVTDQLQTVVDGRAVVRTELSNASANPLLVTDLQPMAGLRLVRLEDERGNGVPPAISLPPGDYDPPVEPLLGRGAPRILVVVLEVADCGRLTRADQDLHFPLMEGSVTGLDGRSTRTAWGGDSGVAHRLRRASCPAPSAIGDVAPLLSEQALRRDRALPVPERCRPRCT